MKKIFFILTAAVIFFALPFNVAKAAGLVDPTIVNLENPIKETVITNIVGNAIKVATGIMGSLAFIVFIYGGFRWLTAAGNSDSVHEGTQAMVWASIGICIVFASYAILNLVFKGLGSQPSYVEIGCYCSDSGGPKKFMPMAGDKIACSTAGKVNKLDCTWTGNPGSPVVNQTTDTAKKGWCLTDNSCIEVKSGGGCVGTPYSDKTSCQNSITPK